MLQQLIAWDETAHVVPNVIGKNAWRCDVRGLLDPTESAKDVIVVVIVLDIDHLLAHLRWTLSLCVLEIAVRSVS